MKRYLLSLLILMIACSSDKEKEQIRNFLTAWSQAITSGKEEAIRKYYDASVILPKVLFDLPTGVTYVFDLENIKITPSAENKDQLDVAIPFTIFSNGVYSEGSTLDLELTKTGNGSFFISGMSQELAVKIKEQGLRLEVNNSQSELVLNYDSIFGEVHAMVAGLRQQYDSIVFFARVDTLTLFYVVNGNWEYPYGYEAQRDAGNYKMGVVTASNRVIIPVEYDKIYNPHGSFYEMIEVEKDGVRGLFNVSGGVFIACEYEGIYPSNVPGVFAQVKQEGRYGWVDDNGSVQFEPSSHPNKKLFQSPVENGAILDWQFTFPGQAELLINPFDDATMANAVIVYPSYMRDLDITSIANSSIMLASSQYGMGTTDMEIKFEKVETISDKFFALVAFFMESGADARGYQTERNDLIVVNKEMEIANSMQGLIQDNGGQDPCEGTAAQYKIIEPGLFETADGHGVFNYYRISEDGIIETQETVREFNFTKFAKIDEAYFGTCYYDNVEYDGAWEEGRPNMVIIRGLSSDDLDIMRNEIYAEYGLIFKSEKWKNYFASKPWYKPQYDNVDKFLSETDKHNVKFIQEYQRNNKNLEVQRDSIQYMWAG